MPQEKSTALHSDGERTADFDFGAFSSEVKILQEEMIHNRPNPKWMGELLYMLSTGEITPSIAKMVQDVYMERRRATYKQLIELYEDSK